MLLDETETENESNSSETTLMPVLRASPSTTLTNRHHRAYLSSTEKQRNRSSVQDVTVLNKALRNVRTSVYGQTMVRQLKEQDSSDNIKSKNLQRRQLAGEEKQQDAIFKIYLEKTPRKTLTQTESSSTIRQLSNDQNEQNESRNNHRGELLYSSVKIYQLKAGTLEKIVECLTNKHGDLDTIHMHISYATYRTYTNTRVLIETILARYRAVVPASLDMTEDVRRKTLKTLSTALIYLLTTYKEDFYEPPTYTILRHLREHAPDLELKNQCHHLLGRFLKDGKDVIQPDLSIFTSTHDVDNNNNSNTPYTDEYLYNQRGSDSDAQRNFLDMSSARIAEQLTIVDADLLKRVLPYECLTMGRNSSIRRGLNPNRSLSTADKTIEQFNAVAYRVIATILKETNEQLRARVLEKWIDIARECRQLKNFSSLTAILNGLQYEPIYRLRKTWSYVDKYHCSILEELRNIFGSCGVDREQVRAILDKQLDEIRLNLSEYSEGTTKHVDVTAAIRESLGKRVRSRKTRDQQNAMIGTVPYLGLYSSDLTYIDSAHENYIHINEKDKSSQKLINFEKHRKTFEILAQIKLFQSAANAYTTLQRIPSFQQWFDNIRTYTDSENWARSYEIEQKETIDTTDNPRLPENSTPTQRTGPLKAFASQVSLESLAISNNQTPEIIVPSSGSSPSLNSLDKMSLASNYSFPQRQQSMDMNEKKTHSNHSRSSSASSFLTDASVSQGYISAQVSPTTSVVNCTVDSAENNTLIAKVHFVGSNDLLYKTVRIGDNERVPSVLKTILEKFNLDPSTHDRYCIEQKLPNRKLVLMDHCNVFYALARRSPDEQVDLIVREKNRQEREQTNIRFHPTSGHNRTPSGLSVSSTHSR